MMMFYNVDCQTKKSVYIIKKNWRHYVSEFLTKLSQNDRLISRPYNVHCCSRYEQRTKESFKNIYTNMNLGEGVPVQGTSVVDPRIVYFESGSCLRTNF